MKIVEYRIHYEANMEILPGTQWRLWKNYINYEGVLWIERVVDTLCPHMGGVVDSDYEILWEAEE